MTPPPTLDIEELRLERVKDAPRTHKVVNATGDVVAIITAFGEHDAAPVLIASARERDTFRARVAELEAQRDRLRGLAEAALSIVQLSAAESPRAAQMWLAVAFEEFSSEEPPP